VCSSSLAKEGGEITHSNFGVDDVDDAAENNDKVKHVPRVTEIVLRQKQKQQSSS